MSGVDLVIKYFPEITHKQQEQLAVFESVLFNWNQKINLVSRKEIHLLAERHILHSLAIAKLINFKPGSRILDAGTGGGFPGIPLSVYFQDVQFTLVDSIAKKTRVVKDVVDQTGLGNVRIINERVENLNEKFDFIVSRAVTRLMSFSKWTWGKISTDHRNTIKNGILYLKGGDITHELKELNIRSEVFDIRSYFEEPFFETKKIVYIPRIR